MDRLTSMGRPASLGAYEDLGTERVVVQAGPVEDMVIPERAGTYECSVEDDLVSPSRKLSDSSITRPTNVVPESDDDVKLCGTPVVINVTTERQSIEDTLYVNEPSRQPVKSLKSTDSELCGILQKGIRRDTRNMYNSAQVLTAIRTCSSSLSLRFVWQYVP